ncbi:protein FAR1-RELATED SEQUENCE 9-like [Quercus lobata]|uniref:protein FAR1-RELATED SEQUENCE 9-like n=1 Tax=Quercus lobata TaxID=97700 RepID=UPI001248F83E|nr:protein FAR1-RELATED SEQUENCE 9-like [Quercus lobata]
MFQDEYLRMGDCKIYWVNKSDTIKEYKVTYRERTQEHLVKYEASTTIVECNCMKFNFIGILCIHALKVLDKKNIRRLPAHYILKRWTKDAKIGSIKDYCGIYIKGNTQESIEKHYSHLSYKFREISTLAKKSEKMYEHTKRCFENLLKDLQEMRKKCYSNSMEGRVEVHGEAIHANVLQGNSGFDSHKDISSQDCVVGHYLKDLYGLNQVSSPSDIIQEEHHIGNNSKQVGFRNQLFWMGIGDKNGWS